ncbi:MAG TPA: HD domain-containing protein [Streptosporangiaceae bacterium]|nr:HD domain-containing protein [Streptosporangiaceae bacterium]
MTVRVAEQRWLGWQTVDTGRLVLLSGAAMLVGIAVAETAVREPSHQIYKVPVAVAFGLYIAFGELLRLVLPGGREAAPIAMSASLAYAMVLTVASPRPAPVPGSHSAHPVSQITVAPVMQIVVVAATGMVIGSLPHIAAGRRAGLTGMSARLVAVFCVALAFHPLAPRLMQDRWLALAVLALLAAFGWMIETVIAAVIRADDLRARYSVTLTDEFRVQWRLGLAVGVSAIVTVFGAEVMGPIELAVFAGPLLVIQLAFRRFAGIRATYLQTVRALAQVTEVGGYVEGGHSRRVSRLALAIGRELGLPEPELLDLEYAALMHDIGQLSLAEPIPGGATLLVSQAEARRIAEFGAEVINQTGVLDTVAELVRDQWLPALGGPKVPALGSKVIHAANAFDDLVGGSPDRDRAAAAIDRLRLDGGREYDPEVVAALVLVTDRLPITRL